MERRSYDSGSTAEFCWEIRRSNGREMTGYDGLYRHDDAIVRARAVTEIDGACTAGGEVVRVVDVRNGHVAWMSEAEKRG